MKEARVSASHLSVTIRQHVTFSPLENVWGYTQDRYRGRHKITHPLDQFSNLCYSASREVSVPKRAALERSRQELFDNVPFALGIILIAELESCQNWCKGVCYLVSPTVHTCHTRPFQRDRFTRTPPTSLLRADLAPCSRPLRN